MTEDFRRHFAELKAKREAVEARIDANIKRRGELGARFFDGTGHSYLLGVSMTGDGAPYRLTHFDQHGPVGHMDLRRSEVAQEVQGLEARGFTTADL